MTSHKQRAKDTAISFYQSMFDQNPEKEFPIVSPSDGRLYVSTFNRYIKQKFNEFGWSVYRQERKIKKANSGGHCGRFSSLFFTFFNNEDNNCPIIRKFLNFFSNFEPQNLKFKNVFYIFI